MPPLSNPRRERFAQALLEGCSADEAFVKAGYSENRGNASRLKAKESISMRLAELQAAAAKASTVSVQSLLSELEEARQKATSLSQLSAVVRAVEAKARVSGLNGNHEWVISDRPVCYEAFDIVAQQAARIEPPVRRRRNLSNKIGV